MRDTDPNCLQVRIMTYMGSDTRSVSSMVADIMQQPVVTVSPSAPLRELISLFLRSGVSGVPVVDVHQNLMGTVSVTDLLWLSDWLTGEGADSDGPARPAENLDETTVRDIMTPDVFGVQSHASLAELGAFFARTGLGRAVVLEAGKLVGIVSVIDLLALLADQTADTGPRAAGDEAVKLG